MGKRKPTVLKEPRANLLITVRGGVAYVARKDAGFSVEIRDYDIEGSDLEDIDGVDMGGESFTRSFWSENEMEEWEDGDK
jgi:hypothetical protein